MTVLKVKSSDLQMEQRSMITLLNFEGAPTKETHLRLCNFYDVRVSQVMSVYHVRKWCTEFLVGRKSIQDEVRSGRPRTVRTPHYVSRIKHLIKTDKQIMI